ncbi:DNase I-like protein [Ascobolus immersus RN42]|uniref:phosphoinositide 5-phosphatase n=1 Tax=Ascobolus immersus RN42 TaxID=1160509 RepID=A0A3N4IQF6_ASCIM|nr:DNase I-like protein [Ascobolus immersus RN42]
MSENFKWLVSSVVERGRKEFPVVADMVMNKVMGPEYAAQNAPYPRIIDPFTAEMRRRAPEYSIPRSEPITIHVATMNMNGRTDGLKQDLKAWICPPSANGKQPDIVAVGLQEMVELSPQQVMSTDPSRRRAWEFALLRTLNDDAVRKGGQQYVMLKAGQLVGAALFIYVKEQLMETVKTVQSCTVKTGLFGIAGNKGAVAIRIEVGGTRLCFITAHLAAGHPNFEERNRDYNTITSTLVFSNGDMIEDHDGVIWFGDFNYRIDLPNETVRYSVARGDLQTLLSADQLIRQRQAGRTFSGFRESAITFNPTYRYDLYTDDYDTSEKMRIPAWTDRILSKGDIFKQLVYTSVQDISFSDHKPIYAVFECKVCDIDPEKRSNVARDITANTHYDYYDPEPEFTSPYQRRVPPPPQFDTYDRYSPPSRAATIDFLPDSNAVPVTRNAPPVAPPPRRGVPPTFTPGLDASSLRNTGTASKGVMVLGGDKVTYEPSNIHHSTATPPPNPEIFPQRRARPPPGPIRRSSVTSLHSNHHQHSTPTRRAPVPLPPIPLNSTKATPTPPPPRRQPSVSSAASSPLPARPSKPQHLKAPPSPGIKVVRRQASLSGSIKSTRSEGRGTSPKLPMVPKKPQALLAKPVLDSPSNTGKGSPSPTKDDETTLLDGPAEVGSWEVLLPTK